MHAFTGTWRLVRLALRRDRVKLPVVILVVAGMFAASAAATIEFYDTPQKQLSYAATNAPSVVGRVFNGPINGPDIGAIVMNETFIVVALAAAFMSTLAVVRHTRQNEEFGRSELIESGVVSRHASLVAALIVVVLANAVLSILVTLSLLSNDLPLAGSIAAGAAIGAIGISFAALATVMAQLADSARGANGFAALVVGVAFLLRAIGDGMGSLTDNGLAVKSAFPSWLSPFGWGQQIHPFTQAQWWIFVLFAVLAMASVVLSVVFMARRDIGMGMIPARPGPPNAPARLLSTFGLTKRLQKGIFRGWAVAIVVLSASYGLIIKEFEDLVAENEEIKKALGELGGNFTDAFVSFMVAFMTITITGYAVQALMRMRSEEANGQLESVLGTSVSRVKWMLSHVSYVILGIAVLTFLSGLCLGTTFILSSGESWGKLSEIIAASFVQGSAVFALSGFVVLLVSCLPRLAIALSWGAFSACILVLQLGVLLKLPQWVMDISPFTHPPAMPAQSFKVLPVASLLLVTIVLSTAGLAYFNRRDVVNS